MHIATKILLVFCAILSLLLAALTMAYASNASAIRVSLRNEQALRTQALADAQAQVAQAASQRAEAEGKLRAMETELGQARAALNGLQSERTNLRSELERATSESAAIRNQISQLGATTDTQAALIKNYREESTRLREALFDAEKKQIQLSDRINDLDSAREVLQQNARALKEQLEETKLALQSAQQAAQSGGAGATAQAASTKLAARELAGPVVRARVSEVFKSPAGDDMVVISEGSNRGLKPSTLMNIVRGDTQFIGSIVITAVEPDRSVGKVNLYARPSESISRDDTALSRLD